MSKRLIYRILTSALLLAAASIIVTSLSLLAMFVFFSPAQDHLEAGMLAPATNLSAATKNNALNGTDLAAPPNPTPALATPAGTQIIPNTGANQLNWLPGLLYLLFVGAVLLATFFLLTSSNAPRNKS